MKRILSLTLCVIMLFSMCACNKYVNSYSAFGLIKNQTSHSCYASFNSLSGQLVFKLKKSDAGTEGDIHYSVTVEKGEINLYYDTFDIKQDLAHVKAGETVTSNGGYVEGGHTVYVIIEAANGTKGTVSVELDD